MRLKSLFKLVPQLKNIDCATLHFRVLDGWSNKNYLFELKGKPYVLREPMVNETEGVNRVAEAHNARIAAQSGLSSNILYFDTKTGISLREFIKGEPPVDDSGRIDIPQIKNCADLMKNLHGLSTPFYCEVDNLKLIQNMANAIEQRAGLPMAYQDIMIQLNGCLPHLTLNDYPIVPCHNDLNPRNFLCTSNGMQLLDWEYSGNGDLAWDIAYFITHGDLDDKAEKLFLDAYFDSSLTETMQYRINLYKPFTLLIFSLWIQLQKQKNYFPVPQEEFNCQEVLLLDEITELLGSSAYKDAQDFYNNNRGVCDSIQNTRMLF